MFQRNIQMKYLKDIIKKFQFAFLFLLTINIVTAQNLVPNPGFEFYNNLPTRVGEWCAATAWYNLTGDCEYDSGGPRSGSPDYFHEDGEYPVTLPANAFSTVFPIEGNGVMGMVLWKAELDTISFREYISTNLTEVLEVGASYTVSFYTSNGNENIRVGGYGSNNLGVYFSTDNLIQMNATPVLVNPHFELNEILYSNDWTLTSFDFIADGEYEYITIGNFRDNANTSVEQFESFTIEGSAYYYIDELCVVKTGEDCSILTAINTPEPTSPAIKIFPNPLVADLLLLSFNKIDLNGNTVLIHNAFGDLVYASSLSCFSEVCEISIEDILGGIYFLTVEFGSERLTQKFIRF